VPITFDGICRLDGICGLDATYSLGENLSGVGVYSREMLFGLARAHPQQRFHFHYRPHRFLKSLSDTLPPNASRRLLRGAPSVDLFHALNQRVDRRARHTVSTFHDLFVMTGDYSSPEFRARFTEQARQAAGSSDAIIAVSRFTASQVEHLLGVEPSRIHVVPHGARHGVGLPPASPAAPRENLVLFVGVIQRRKNVARLVKAFEHLPPGWRLALAGASQGFGAAAELSAVENSPRRHDIDVLGHLSASQLASLYARARIFAFPSLDEGFGMPVLEAMAHGVPVVTSNCSAMPEVAGGAALLVDPRNVEELGSALARLAADVALREELIQRGRARAGQFTWDSAIARTWAVYEKVMAGS
jgi:glycosyltransferase involved in cell wall biosynthesis